MPRPVNKQQLIQASEENFGNLLSLIGSMSERERGQEFSFEDRDRNIRDVLVHLYEWHMLLLNWIRSNQAGQKAEFLPAPYNWKTYPEMNIGFRDKHSSTSLNEAMKLFEESHAGVMEITGSFSNEELFEKKYFPWTGNTSLGSYCISSCSSHYDWAIKKIKRHKKTLAE